MPALRKSRRPLIHPTLVKKVEVHQAKRAWHMPGPWGVSSFLLHVADYAIALVGFHRRIVSTPSRIRSADENPIIRSQVVGN